MGGLTLHWSLLKLDSADILSHALSLLRQLSTQTVLGVSASVNSK